MQVQEQQNVREVRHPKLQRGHLRPYLEFLAHIIATHTRGERANGQRGLLYTTKKSKQKKRRAGQSQQAHPHMAIGVRISSPFPVVGALNQNKRKNFTFKNYTKRGPVCSWVRPVSGRQTEQKTSKAQAACFGYFLQKKRPGIRLVSRRPAVSQIPNAALRMGLTQV
jgi:hypothetical protein